MGDLVLETLTVDLTQSELAILLDQLDAIVEGRALAGEEIQAQRRKASQ